MWYHQEEDTPPTAGRDEEAVAAGSAGGGMSEASFGNTTEEIESFLLAMLEMKGGGARQAPDKGAAFRENLRSW